MCFPARARAHRQRRLRSNRSRSTLQRFPRQPFDRTWTPWEAPGRQERISWTACAAPGRHQGGRKNHLDSLGGEAPGRQPGGTRDCTREAGKSHLRTGLPIESRFWKSAGFCISLNTISMAIGPVRGKSWGGLHGWLPVAQTGL